MSISGISGSSNAAYLFQLFGQHSASSTEHNPLKRQIQSALSQIGYGTDEINAISEEIGAAIDEATAIAGTGVDRKEITDWAIESVLAEHDVDAVAFQAAMALVGGPQKMGPPPSPPSDTDGVTDLLESVAKELGTDTSNVTDLISQIDAAVQAALEGLGEDANPQAAIESAVSGALAESGLDPETFQAALESAIEEQGPHVPGNGIYASRGSIGAIGSSGSTESGMLEQLLAQLQSPGASTSVVDSPSLNLWQILQNLPGGSLVDARV